MTSLEKPRVERAKKPRVERAEVEKPRVERAEVEKPRVEREEVEKPRIERAKKPRIERAKKPRPKRIGQKIADRWTKRIVSEGYTPVAEVFLRLHANRKFDPKGTGLSPTETLVVVHLMSFKWDARQPHPRVKTLAERLDISTRAVSKALKGLEDRKFIERGRSPRGYYQFDLSGLFAALERWMDQEEAANVATGARAKRAA